MKCQIQACGKHQPCRMFIENNLAVEITMSVVKTNLYLKGNFELINMVKYCVNNNHWV